MPRAHRKHCRLSLYLGQKRQRRNSITIGKKHNYSQTINYPGKENRIRTNQSIPHLHRLCYDQFKPDSKSSPS